LGLLIAMLLSALAFGTVQAQGEQPTDDEVNAVAKGLYCPVCPNTPLDVCETTACKQWRESIREKLAQGWSQGQIEQFFVSQYGDRVLATPPATGLNWLVYLLPPVGFVAGALILAQAVRFRPPKHSCTGRPCLPRTGRGGTSPPWLILTESRGPKSIVPMRYGRWPAVRNVRGLTGTSA